VAAFKTLGVALAGRARAVICPKQKRKSVGAGGKGPQEKLLPVAGLG